jgi:hypothetical protein
MNPDHNRQVISSFVTLGGRYSQSQTPQFIFFQRRTSWPWLRPPSPPLILDKSLDLRTYWSNVNTPPAWGARNYPYLVASKSPTWSMIWECLNRAGIEAYGIQRYCTTFATGLMPWNVPKDECLNVVDITGN